jgi:putative salt-induced outer membrane protein YdiY
MQSEGEETGNRLYFEGRNEWKIAESRWSIYGHQTTEYDEFRDWRTRIGMDGGLGYNLIKNDFTSLTVRGGPSVSHEFRGPSTDWTPEIATGLQLDHKLSQRQKFNFQIDYFPDVRDFNEYRINTQAAWEIVLDQINNLSLKLSAISRYDTTPSGESPDDLDYAATLLWSF